MPVQISGAVSNVAADVDGASRALKITLRGNDPGTLGGYRKAMTSGTIGAGLVAASNVYGFRWAPTPTTALAVLRRISLSAGSLGSFSTPGLNNFQAFFVRTFTSLDNAGGTAGTFTTNNAKKRTIYPPSAGATCYIAGTGVTSGGTQTGIDTEPFAAISNSVIAGAGATLLQNGAELYRAVPGDYPIVFVNLEGFLIRATVPGNGTWQLGVDVEWDEFTAF